jgi:signal recognition particle GTPase
MHHQVLNELGQKITDALAKVAGDGSSASALDEAAVDACLKDICTALLQVCVRWREAWLRGVSARTCRCD